MLTTKELLETGWTPYAIRKKVSAGEWIKVRRGLYYPTDAVASDWQLIETMFPKGVWALTSAAAIHELSTYVPHQHHLAIPRKTRPSLPKELSVRFLYWKNKRYQLGRTLQTVDGTPIAVYDKEKTVCDFFRYRKKIDEALVKEVIRNYITQPDKDLNRLARYAKELGDWKVVNQYFKILL